MVLKNVRCADAKSELICWVSKGVKRGWRKVVSRKKFIETQKKVCDILEKSSIVLTDAEKENIEVADFGLGDIESTGLQIVTYINTDRVCAKELIMFAGQTCPEHRHV